MVKLTVWSAAGVTTLAVLAALVVLAGCTTSGGESAEPTQEAPGGPFPGGQPPFGGGGGGLGLTCGGDRSMIQTAADTLGISPQEMISQLRSGVTIEDMAAAAGLTFEEFDAAVCGGQ